MEHTVKNVTASMLDTMKKWGFNFQFFVENGEMVVKGSEEDVKFSFLPDLWSAAVWENFEADTPLTFEDLAKKHNIFSGDMAQFSDAVRNWNKEHPRALLVGRHAPEGIPNDVKIVST